MIKYLLLLLLFFNTKTFNCQTENRLLIGELTLTQAGIEKAAVGDTLYFAIAKKPFKGSIKLHSDTPISAWSTCILDEKKYGWCKIGTWEKSDFIVFTLTNKTIVLKNINADNLHASQKLVVKDIR